MAKRAENKPCLCNASLVGKNIGIFHFAKKAVLGKPQPLPALLKLIQESPELRESLKQILND